MSYTNYSFDLNIGEGLCTFTSFHFLDSGLYLTNGFDFYFGLFWMAWDWKPAIKRRGYLITVKTRVGRVQLYHVRLIVLLIVVVVDSFFFCGERLRLEAWGFLGTHLSASSLAGLLRGSEKRDWGMIRTSTKRQRVVGSDGITPFALAFFSN